MYKVASLSLKDVNFFKIKNYKDVRKPATLDDAPSTSTKAIQPMQRSYVGRKNEIESKL